MSGYWVEDSLPWNVHGPAASSKTFKNKEDVGLLTCTDGLSMPYNNMEVYKIHTCEDDGKYIGEFKGRVKHGLGPCLLSFQKPGHVCWRVFCRQNAWFWCLGFCKWSSV
ncbi:hypothetical protein Hdeb2414_s0013g00405431 [Helianthus debilis subsp. tardiflorus]